MRRGRVVTVGIVTIAVALVAASAAIAASPRQIYADFADNGRLDGNYSAGDLERALADAEGQGYPGAGQSPARAAIKNRLGQRGAAAGAPVRAGTLPFTGVDLVLLTSGAVFLLLVGWSFRRLGRARS